jgi:hypothetical protein
MVKLVENPVGCSIINSLNVTAQDYQIMANNQQSEPADRRPVIKQNKIHIRISVIATTISSQLGQDQYIKVLKHLEELFYTIVI